MTKPFELKASEAIKLIRNKKLSIHEWVLSCFERIKEKEETRTKKQRKGMKEYVHKYKPDMVSDTIFIKHRMKSTLLTCAGG